MLLYNKAFDQNLTMTSLGKGFRVKILDFIRLGDHF